MMITNRGQGLGSMEIATFVLMAVRLYVNVCVCVQRRTGRHHRGAGSEGVFFFFNLP